MPKYVPTFKHLFTSSQPTQQSEHRERNVNDLIANSRAHEPVQRDLPPHIDRGERVWAPSAGLTGLPDVEYGGVHPAELLRRSYVSQRQASRSVAGPAPPPSWRVPASAARSTPSKSAAGSSRSSRPVTTVELREASELFSRRLPEIPTAGPNRLLEHCLLTVLRYLDDDEVITLDENEDLDESEGDRVADPGWTRGELLREQAGYLESPLKSALLEMSSLQPEGSALRLSDVSLKAMLGYSDPGQSSHPSDQPDEWDGTSVHSTGSWETADTTLPHLPLILHPAPHAILRLLPSLHSLSLTSLNLAYSTEPMELEKLVNVLPAGLRELGLAGIRIGRGKSGGQEEWRRGLGVLSRKLIVLRMLDLSFPPFPVSTHLLATLLHPPSVKLPSLRILGLRGTRDTSGHAGSTSQDDVRKLRDIIKSGRQRWIDVIW